MKEEFKNFFNKNKPEISVQHKRCMLERALAKRIKANEKPDEVMEELYFQIKELRKKEGCSDLTPYVPFV